MDTGEGTSTQRQTTDGLMLSGSTVIIQLPNGESKLVKLERNSSISNGKYGSFEANALIGKPYGLSYEVVGRSLKVLPPRTLREIEDTDATNELINDVGSVQPLTAAEIEALKQSGVHASEIIQMQIKQHVNYQLKTEYSKDKYKKRKEAKFSKAFTTTAPTVYNVCEYWFNKDQSRIRDIRPDTLSQILNMGNVRPGGRYLAVDEASGILVAAILERLGGNGRLITICDVESPPAYPILAHMNFDESLVSSVLASLNWATADEGYAPILPPMEPSSGQVHSERQRHRLEKRKHVAETLFSIREELFAGEFEGLLVASEYEPFSIVEKATPYLAGSASIVIHSPHAHVLAGVQAKMRALPDYLGPAITEPWLRRYQVLPGRTHPTMTTSGTGGYLLHATRVIDTLDGATPLPRSRNKRRKTEAADDNAAVVSRDSTDVQS